MSAAISVKRVRLSSVSNSQTMATTMSPSSIIGLNGGQCFKRFKRESEGDADGGNKKMKVTLQPMAMANAMGADKKLDDEAAATLLMLANSAVDHFKPRVMQLPVVSLVASTCPSTATTISLGGGGNRLHQNGAQLLHPIMSSNGNNFQNFRVANGQLTKIVAVHRIETAAALPYNQLIKVVKDLPTLVKAAEAVNGLSTSGGIKNESSPRIVFQPAGSFMSGLPQVTVSMPSGLTRTHTVVHTQPSAAAGSAAQATASTSWTSIASSSKAPLVINCSQGSTSSFLSQGSTSSFNLSQAPSSSSYMYDGHPSTSSGSSQDDEDDDGSDSNGGKRGRKVKYPRPEGAYNPVKEFRNRQRKQQHEEDELLAQLEEEYCSNTQWTMTLDELYLKHDLVELVPERTEKRIKRKEAENIEEKKMRKRLQARRDSKNYREREKRRREYITKRIKLLQYLRTRSQIADPAQAELWAATLHAETKKKSLEYAASCSGASTSTAPH